MQPLPHTRSCFVCGEANPLGLNLRFETDGRLVRAKFLPRPEHAGFKGVVHGGIIATVLDEIMVWACAAQTRRFSYCAELNVRFLSPMPPGREVLVTGELVTNRKGRLYEATAAVCDAAGLKFAQATGKYRPMQATDGTRLATDFVGGEGWLLNVSLPAQSSLHFEVNPQPLQGAGFEETELGEIPFVFDMGANHVRTGGRKIPLQTQDFKVGAFAVLQFFLFRFERGLGVIAGFAGGLHTLKTGLGEFDGIVNRDHDVLFELLDI